MYKKKMQSELERDAKRRKHHRNVELLVATLRPDVTVGTEVTSQGSTSLPAAPTTEAAREQPIVAAFRDGIAAENRAFLGLAASTSVQNVQQGPPMNMDLVHQAKAGLIRTLIHHELERHKALLKLLGKDTRQNAPIVKPAEPSQAYQNLCTFLPQAGSHMTQMAGSNIGSLPLFLPQRLVATTKIQPNEYPANYLKNLSDLGRLPKIAPVDWLSTRGSNVTSHPDRKRSILHVENQGQVVASSPQTKSAKERPVEHRLIPISLESDKTKLSKYQAILRENVCLFTATAEDLLCSSRSRNKPCVIGQVGVICRHCAALPPCQRSRGAMYFPAQINNIYQAVQNMAASHFLTSCPRLPQESRRTMMTLKEEKEVVWGGGKPYWVIGAKALGVEERSNYLVFGSNDSVESAR